MILLLPLDDFPSSLHPVKLQTMGDFDSSDDENLENMEPLDQLRVDWINIPRWREGRNYLGNITQAGHKYNLFSALLFLAFSVKLFVLN